MTAARSAPTPYLSGWCGTAAHDHCRGAYAGIDCSCPCHAQPEPDPEPTPLHHCPSCTCVAAVSPQHAAPATLLSGVDPDTRR